MHLSIMHFTLIKVTWTLIDGLSFPLASTTNGDRIDICKRANLTEICQTTLMVSVAYGQGRIQGVGSG